MLPQDAAKKLDKDWQAAEESAAKRRRTSQSQKKEQLQKVMDVVDNLGGTEITVVSFDDDMNLQASGGLDELNWQAPILLRLGPGVLAKPELNREVNSLKSKWANSPERTHPGRGHRPMIGKPGCATFLKLMSQLTPESARLPEGAIKPDSALAPHMWPVMFAISQSKVAFNQEAGHMGSFRMIFEGFRQLWIVPTKPAYSHVSAKLKKNNIPMREFNSIMKDATPDDIKTFLSDTEGASFIHCTTGPQDCLWVPPGWSLCERINDKADVFGIKCAAVGMSHLPALEEMNRIVLAQSKQAPDEKLQSAVDCLTLLS